MYLHSSLTLVKYRPTAFLTLMRLHMLLTLCALAADREQRTLKHLPSAEANCVCACMRACVQTSVHHSKTPFFCYVVAWVPCDSSIRWNIPPLSCRFASTPHLMTLPSPFLRPSPLTFPCPLQPSPLFPAPSACTSLCFWELFESHPVRISLTNPGTMLMWMPCSSLLAAHELTTSTPSCPDIFLSQWTFVLTRLEMGQVWIKRCFMYISVFV